MGLKNKAIAANEKTGSLAPVLSKELPPELSPEEAYEKDFSDKLQKKRKISTEDLLSPVNAEQDELSPYLLGQDIESHTLPVDSVFPLQNRLESLLNLLEVCKELATLESEEDLWSSIIYSILGQVGIKEIAVFFKEDNRTILKATKGFIIPEDFQLSKRSGIERVLEKDLAIHYSREIINRIVGDEQTLLKTLHSELVVPILNYSSLAGFIIVGKPISRDFHPDDLLYLKLLGELIGSFRNTIERISFMDFHKQSWIDREAQFNEFVYFQNRIQYAADLPEAQSILQDFLDRLFHFNTYMFFIKEENDFVSHSQKGFQEETTNQFEINIVDPWLIAAKNKNTWYHFKDFRDDTTFMRYFSAEDGAILNDVHILPFHMHGVLEGVFLLFDVVDSVDSRKMNHAYTVLLNYFWFSRIEILGESLHSEQFRSEAKPLHAVQSLLRAREDKVEKNNLPYSVYTVYITNATELRNLLEDFGYDSMKRIIKDTLEETIGTINYMSEIIPDRYFLILDGMEKDSLWKLDKRFHKKLKNEFLDVQPILQSRLYSRPQDNLKSLETLLFI
ncbi:MAG: hypothetical protein ABUK01_12585 [Leptospirales bacterium]